MCIKVIYFENYYCFFKTNRYNLSHKETTNIPKSSRQVASSEVSREIAPAQAKSSRSHR